MFILLPKLDEMVAKSSSFGNYSIENSLLQLFFKIFPFGKRKF